MKIMILNENNDELANGLYKLFKEVRKPNHLPKHLIEENDVYTDFDSLKTSLEGHMQGLFKQNKHTKGYKNKLDKKVREYRYESIKGRLGDNFDHKHEKYSWI